MGRTVTHNHSALTGRLRKARAPTSTLVEKTVGADLYRSILRDYGRVNQPKLIRDAAVKRKVLQILESAARGLDRLHALAKPLDSNALQALLEKLQAPP
jgi:hypothetical protein